MYAGDATHYPETATLSQNVVFVPNLPPSFTSSLNPSGFGQPVTFSVVLFSPTATSGSPSGSIVFSDGATTLATAPLGHYLSTANSATFTTPMLSAGSHTIKATYVPTGNNTAVTLSLTQVVIAGPSATTTAMTLCIGPSTYCPASGGGVSAPNTTPLTEFFGQTFNESTQVVSGDGTALTGSISFIDVNAGKTTTLCTISVAPGNYCPPSFNTTYFPGANVITAVYSGDATHLASTSAPITINMMPDATLVTMTSSGDPPLVPTCPQSAGGPPPSQPYPAQPYTSYYGQPVTFSATISSPGYGAPTGSVFFLDEISDTPPPVGSPIVPDAVNTLGSGTIVPSSFNQSEGVASFTTTSLPAGNHPLSPYYPGNADFLPFAQIQNAPMAPGCVGTPNYLLPPMFAEEVLRLPTETALTSSNNPSISGQPVTFTATVIQDVPPTVPPQPPAIPSLANITGPITFYDGNTALGTVMLNNGVGTFTTSSLTVGNHTITTTYAGTANIATSFGYVTQLVYVPAPGAPGAPGSPGSPGGGGTGPGRHRHGRRHGPSHHYHHGHALSA